MNIERGDILLIDFNPTRGSEIQKIRPAIVVTNNVANRYSSVLMVIPVTSQGIDKVFPHEVLLDKEGLSKLSKANTSQMRAVDRLRIKSKLGKVSASTLRKIEHALRLHLGLA